MKNSGFSLTEVIVVLGISTIIGLMIAAHLSTMKKTEDNFQKVLAAEQDFAQLYRSIRTITDRSRDISFSYFGSITPPYYIYGQGAIGFRADLSPCNTLNPATPVWTPVVLLCCAQNMTTASGFINSITAAPGFAVPSIAGGPYTSACTSSTGLSLQKGAQKMCYPHISELHLLKMGYHGSSGTDLLLLDLKSNRSLTGTSTVPVKGLSMFFGLGYTGASTLSFCSQSLGLE